MRYSEARQNGAAGSRDGGEGADHAARVRLEARWAGSRENHRERIPQGGAKGV